MEAQKTARELFTEAVRAVLETWPVLQIAVDNGFGGVYGQQKADWMVDVVQQYFHDNENLQPDEVEDYIADLMNNEFDTVVDDGSLPQVAQKVSQIFTQCQQGKLAEVKDQIVKLNKSAERAKVTPQPNAAEECNSDETEFMECEAATSTNPPRSSAPKQTDQPQSQEENDGWTTVVRRK
ncbi:pre-rRNA-processing protein TSR2 homolog [Oncorhynchus mykiss]|uniref:Pre-rRNA-processing protein TSR2 homolog n=1 Tax=Oncorhynchus mykiss TaxID=8022 RepID=A0A8C7T249_ONCMY|nr:pre-rRNA-processing protein TSR2 homolog [Oncorhynchus mykiss]